MKKIKQFLSIAVVVLIISGCEKDFLDKKPSSNILTPVTVQELNSLLENTSIMNKTAGLPQISADEYRIITEQNFLSLSSSTQRNAYIWARDIFEGEINADWENSFSQIFYCNSVLKILREQRLEESAEGRKTKGWAFFCRAYAYFDLMRNFTKAYQPSTADLDLGLPLRLSPDVDETVQRSSLKQTLDQILEDVDRAAALLDPNVPENNRNRPSKAAAFALKARIGIYIRDYAMAEISADSSFKYHDRIINYNSISRTSATPFSYNAQEIVFASTQIAYYSSLTGYNSQPAIEVDPALIQSYRPGDLRKSIYFLTNTFGRLNVKRGYLGGGSYPFTGLACDEMYLIKAECLSRRGETFSALRFLDRLLINRFEQGTFTPTVAASPQEALDLILLERRKELVWRGLRWSDLKRLNIEGRDINLIRQLGASSFTLPANDPRYVFPIPDNEVAMSGITQNPR